LPLQTKAQSTLLAVSGQQLVQCHGEVTNVWRVQHLFAFFGTLKGTNDAAFGVAAE